MSILIKGMEMPKSCNLCWALDDYGDYPRCRITEEQRGYNFRIRENRMDDCPLVLVPPHGRLIEESKVLDIVSEWCPDDDGSVGKVGDLREMLDEIEALPTIIPAEEGET